MNKFRTNITSKLCNEKVFSHIFWICDLKDDAFTNNTCFNFLKDCLVGKLKDIESLACW